MAPNTEKVPEDKKAQKAVKLSDELKERRDDLRRLADEVRVRIHLGGMDAKDAWRRIQPRLEDFEHRLEAAGAELGKEVRVLGSALKAELQKLRERL